MLSLVSLVLVSVVCQLARRRARLVLPQRWGYGRGLGASRRRVGGRRWAALAVCFVRSAKPRQDDEELVAFPARTHGEGRGTNAAN